MSRKTQLAETVKRYRAAYKKHGDSPKSLLWNSKDSAEIRYYNLIADLDFEGESILDIGCGMGNIIPYIEQQAKNFTYTGIDLLPEFVNEAQKLYPQHRFLAGDYKELMRPADIVMCSGALNSNIPNVVSERKEAVSMMFDYANEVLAFNMAGGHPQPKNYDSYIVHYIDSVPFIEFLFTLTSKVIIRHNYSRKDFTAILFKS